VYDYHTILEPSLPPPQTLLLVTSKITTIEGISLFPLSSFSDRGKKGSRRPSFHMKQIGHTRSLKKDRCLGEQTSEREGRNRNP